MLNWCTGAQPRPRALQREADVRAPELRAAGMHSLVFLPDEGECAAIMIATGEDASAVERIARAISPRVYVRIESMRFDDDPAMPAWIIGNAGPTLPGDGLAALYDEVAAA
jgi:hypothetical protein